MTIKLKIAFLVLLIYSCGRSKDPDELVLHEMIIEKNGVYYLGDCKSHATQKFSGTDTCYFENGKVKATYTIMNGLPDGHWEQFFDDGRKKLDMYFDNGLILEKKIAK